VTRPNQIRRVRTQEIRSEDPAHRDDHGRPGAGMTERRGGALGPSPADIGVVEQDDPGPTGGRLVDHGEGQGVRPHGSDRCSGSTQERRQPTGRAAQGADDKVTQPRNPFE
jgi:hypothetical protein